jgi:hypothetical protein
MIGDLKKIGAIGTAIYVVSTLAGLLLPVPHYYRHEYVFFYGPIGAFIGYGFGSFIVERAQN